MKFDKDNKYIIEDDVIRFNQYPYAAILALAQSRDGNVYYGAYDIYRLQSINSDYKRQILFPIQINTTNKVYVKDLQINQDEKKRTMTIDLAYNRTSDGPYSQVITLKVPKAFLDGIYNITNTENNITEVVNSSIDTTLPTYSIIMIKLTSETHSQLAIVGTKHE